MQKSESPKNLDHLVIMITVIITVLIYFVISGCANYEKVGYDYLPSFCELSFEREVCYINKKDADYLEFSFLQHEQDKGKHYYLIDDNDLKILYQSIKD